MAAYRRRSLPQTPMRKYIGHEHDFPENVEEKKVERKKDAEHAGLEQEKQDVILLGPLLNCAPGRK